MSWPPDDLWSAHTTDVDAGGHVVNHAKTACGWCWTDALRNGVCTEPACTKYGVKQ